MKTERVLLIGGAVLAIGIAWTAGFVYYANANASQAPAVATPAASPSETLAPMSSSAPDKKALLGEVMTASATYLGISTSDLKMQLQSGKSLAEIANAAPGKSRDGLVAALSGVAEPKVIAKLVDRTVTPT